MACVKCAGPLLPLDTERARAREAASNRGGAGVSDACPVFVAAHLCAGRGGNCTPEKSGFGRRTAPLCGLPVPYQLQGPEGACIPADCAGGAEKRAFQDGRIMEADIGERANVLRATKRALCKVHETLAQPRPRRAAQENSPLRKQEPKGRAYFPRRW